MVRTRRPDDPPPEPVGPTVGTGTMVVVPTFCEAGNIERFLSEVGRALPGATVLIVDDEGGDGTADLAEAHGRAHGGVEVLRRTTKEGLGPAYLAGFAVALERNASVVVGMDADLSHDPAVLPDLLAAIDAGADVAVGSRYVPGGTTVDWPVHRRLLSRGGNLYATRLLRLDINDATSAYRALRADALRRVDLERLSAHGYGFVIELAYRLARAGATFAEVPITFTDRTAGYSKMSPAIAAEAMAFVTRTAWRERHG